MSWFRPPAPPEDAWPMLLAWREQPWTARYRQALSFVGRVLTFVFAMASAALLVFEPSWRTVFILLGVWAILIPLTALGYMRKLDRMAMRIPATKADRAAH